MEDWQQGVVDEQNDLGEKITRLQAFCNSSAFDAIPEAEQARQKSQLSYMEGYRASLRERIAAF